MSFRIDQPDDYDVVAPSDWRLLSDVGELAARLGSPMTHDRRGQVMFLDDLESGIVRYGEIDGGTNGQIVWSEDSARSYGHSLKVIASTDGARMAGIGWGLGVTPSRRVGVQCMAAFPGEPGVFEMGMYLQSWAGGAQAALRVDGGSYRLRCYDAVGGWVDVGDGLRLAAGCHVWHHLKLAADFERGRYLYLLVDGEEYDVSVYSVGDVPETGGLWFYFYIVHYATNAYNTVCYIDDIIVTGAE
jgi:hypothetical protein